jgi:ATP-dependent Clp protease ATP-binding subunit ClpX
VTPVVETCCTFCTKPSGDVERIVAGPGVCICNECIGLCNELIALPKSAPAAVIDPDKLSDEEILGLLPQIARVASQVDAALDDWVGRLRKRGVSWARIGTALGMARQSAWERFSAEDAPRPT